jgi:DNA-binding LacI/PurR family transcriptional regulator
MVKSTLQHEKLADQLWDELTRLSPGDKFLSIREIMKRYSVSQLTVEKALMRFREEGYLNNHSGKGLFASDMVKRFSTSVKPTYLLVVPQWVSVDINVLEETVRKVKSKYPEKRLLVHKFDVSNNVPAQLPLLEESVEGVVLLPASEELSLADLNMIKSYACPTVILEWHLNSVGFKCVGSDDTFSGNLAAHHLISNGHKKIAVLVSEPHNRIILDRLKAIQNYAELRGVSVEVIDCGVKSGEYAMEKAYRKFCQVIKAGYDFTAVAGISGESMQGAVNACLNNGVQVPDDLSFVAIAAEKLTATMHPQIDAVAVCIDLQVEKALEMLDAEICGVDGNVDDYFVRPYVIERGSTRKLTK